ncbi:MAG: transposase [Deltaproteobacteria bacterium]|nr:transposase [Deltaproteobacteria bacterium]
MGRIHREIRSFVPNRNYYTWLEANGSTLKQSEGEFLQLNNIVDIIEESNLEKLVKKTDPVTPLSGAVAGVAMPEAAMPEAAMPGVVAVAAMTVTRFENDNTWTRSNSGLLWVPSQSSFLSSAPTVQNPIIFATGNTKNSSLGASASISYNNQYQLNVENANSLSDVHDYEPNNPEFQVYGPTYLLTHLMKQSGLFEILQSVFPEVYKEIITLIHFFILEKREIQYCSHFARLFDTMASPASVESPRTSELLFEISEKDVERFYHEWSSHIDDNEYLAFDVTNIGTYLQFNEYAEYGKPKPSSTLRHLKQINLCLLYAQKSKIPVYPAVYSGSLNDVSLLIDVLQNLEYVSKNFFGVTMDRGFFSNNNLGYLINHDPKIPFIIALPGTTKMKQKLIEQNQHIYRDPNFGINTASGPIYGTTNRIYWDIKKKKLLLPGSNDYKICCLKKYLYSYIFLDQNKQLDIHNKLLIEFLDAYDKIKDNPGNYINDEEVLKYVEIIESIRSEIGYNISLKSHEFKRLLSTAGWFIFIANDNMDPLDALKNYRRRDIVEKAFWNIKCRIGLYRPRTGRSRVFNNKYFICFLSLIVLSSIFETMWENKLFKQYTVDELLLTLNTITIRKRGSLRIISPLTAKQKRIFDYFNCPYPVTFTSKS